MYKKDIMREFFETIYNRGLMTEFIKNIFGYTEFFDYNYIYRCIDKDNGLIIDIYDNVTDSKFNRYIFNFNECDYDYREEIDDRLHIHKISVLNIEDSNNKLMKIAYLFKIVKAMFFNRNRLRLC